LTKEAVISSQSTAHEFRYSILDLAGYHFGVEITNVREVVPFPKYTKIPNVHPSIIGVFNLRGQIYSILDIRRLLNLDTKPVTDKNFVVTLGLENFTFGIYVDKVLDMLRIDENKIELPTRDMSTQFISYLNGVYDHKALGTIYLLDVQAIINSKEISQYRF